MQVFTIRRSFLLPLGILLFLALLLLTVVLVQGQPTIKAVLLGVMILPVAGLFIESFFRRIGITAEAVTAFKPLRQKVLNFSDIVSVDTIQVKKRVFLTLSSEDHFLIISNAYADFPELVKSLLPKVTAEAISEETTKMAADPPTKSSDILSCWLGVLLLAIILVLQFT